MTISISLYNKKIITEKDRKLKDEMKSIKIITLEYPGLLRSKKKLIKIYNPNIKNKNIEINEKIKKIK